MTASLALKVSAFAVAMFWCALRVWRVARGNPDGWQFHTKWGIVLFWSLMAIFAALLWYVVSPNIGVFLLSLVVVAAVGWFQQGRAQGQRGIDPDAPRR